MTEELVEIVAAERDKRGAGVGRRLAKRRVEHRQEPLGQIAIGRGDGLDTGHAQLVDQAILERPIRPLTAAPGLGRETHDVFDPQLPEGSPELRELEAVRGGAGGGRVHGPVRAIGVEGAGDATSPITFG